MYTYYGVDLFWVLFLPRLEFWNIDTFRAPKL
jgi:hypothetical protein